jgi:hypothetical protein
MNDCPTAGFLKLSEAFSQRAPRYELNSLNKPLLAFPLGACSFDDKYTRHAFPRSRLNARFSISALRLSKKSSSFQRHRLTTIQALCPLLAKADIPSCTAHVRF